jgi:TonB family protein
MDVVSEVIVDRSRELEGIERMVGASVIAHVALVAFVALAPATWFGGRPLTPEENVMIISLGGPEGPRTGMTTMSARPVQTESVEPRKAIEPIRPPAAQEPEMIEPKKVAPKKTETKTQAAAKDPRGRTPTKGAEVRQGTAVAETNARGMGFGLSQGGFGSGSYLEVSNFCCPEYLSTMLSLIRRNWDERQQAAGTTVMRFVIQRDGTITDVTVKQSSGYPALDFMAERSLRITRQVPPLPAGYTGQNLPVNLIYEYNKR